MTHRGAKATWLDPAFLAILVLAIALRVPGLATDFWLDEIWTWKIVGRLRSAFGVFTEVRHSNNHHLNTLVFYWLGDLLHWSLYRIHSLLAGAGSVWLAWRIGIRRGRAEAIFASGLCATSYLLIHFSSEARGYALVVFFSLAAYTLLQQYLDDGRWQSSLLFGAASCLGFLSHLMFIHTFLASGAWATLVLAGRERPARAFAGLLRLFAAPGAFLLWLYWIDIRFTKIGDGPELDALDVLLRGLSYSIGGPGHGSLVPFAAALAVVVLAGALVWLARHGRSEWLFFAVVVFASPAVFYAVMRPEVFFVRYFLLSATFGLIALAPPLAAAWRGGHRRPAGALLALLLLGNGVDTARFYRDGRGSYLEAMRFMVEQTPDGIPTVAGDHRFRTTNVIRFYNRYLPANEQVIYLPQDRYPEWLLLHRIGELGRVDEFLKDDHGHAYELVRIFPYSDLSGWHWLAYRRWTGNADR